MTQSIRARRSKNEQHGHAKPRPWQEITRDVLCCDQERGIDVMSSEELVGRAKKRWRVVTGQRFSRLISHRLKSVPLLDAGDVELFFRGEFLW